MQGRRGGAIHENPEIGAAERKPEVNPSIRLRRRHQRRLVLARRVGAQTLPRIGRIRGVLKRVATTKRVGRLVVEWPADRRCRTRCPRRSERRFPESSSERRRDRERRPRYPHSRVDHRRPDHAGARRVIEMQDDALCESRSVAWRLIVDQSCTAAGSPSACDSCRAARAFARSVVKTERKTERKYREPAHERGTFYRRGSLEGRRGHHRDWCRPSDVKTVGPAGTFLWIRRNLTRCVSNPSSFTGRSTAPSSHRRGVGARHAHVHHRCAACARVLRHHARDARPRNTHARRRAHTVKPGAVFFTAPGKLRDWNVEGLDECVCFSRPRS